MERNIVKNEALSDRIVDFLALLDQVKADNAFAQDELTRLDQLIQDHLHRLELIDLSYHEQAKVARALKECRIARRAVKDTITVTEPILEFVESERGQMAVNHLQQVLGKVRRAEKNAQLRHYSPRVMSFEEYTSGDTLKQQK